MKILSIGTDRKIFESGSSVSTRAIEYGKKVEEMHIIVYTLKKNSVAQEKVQLSDTVFAYPTNSSSRWMYIFDAMRIGKKIIIDRKFVRGQSVITAQDPFECGLVAYRLGKIFRLPFHIQIHTDFLSPYFTNSFLQKIRVKIAKYIVPKAAGIRVVSQRIADSLVASHMHLSATLQILPIRIDTQKIERAIADTELQERFPEFKFIILMASRLSKEKRIHDALHACEQVLKKYPFVGLVIAGEGSERMYLESVAKALHIEKQVVFLGERNDIPSLMKSVQCFLSTSEFEGYGMSVIEAGLSGLPVVATRAGISGEILNDKNSLLCPIGDVACLADQVDKLISDNALREILAQTLMNDIRVHIPSQEEYIISYIQGLTEAASHISV